MSVIVGKYTNMLTVVCLWGDGLMCDLKKKKTTLKVEMERTLKN